MRRRPVPTTAIVRPPSSSARLVRGAVDPLGEPAHDRVARGDEAGGDRASGVEAARRRAARADDGDRALVLGAEPAANEEERGPVVDRAEVDGVVVAEHGDEAHALLLPGRDLVADRVEIGRGGLLLLREEDERLVLVGIDVATLQDRERAARSLGELRVVVPGAIASADEGDEGCVLASIVHGEHVFYQVGRPALPTTVDEQAAGCATTLEGGGNGRRH